MISPIARPARTALALIIAVACCSLAAAAEPESAAGRPDDIRALLQLNGSGNISAQVGPVAAQQIIVALHRVNPNLPARADVVVKDVVVDLHASTSRARSSDRPANPDLLEIFYKRRRSAAHAVLSFIRWKETGKCNAWNFR
jgi:hypothetical protein